MLILKIFLGRSWLIILLKVKIVMACCYEDCSNTRKKNPNLTFFRFPREKERRYLWMKKCNNKSIQNLSFEELQNRVICEEHFLPICFDYSVLASGKTRRSLFKFALPQPASVIAALKKDDESRNVPPSHFHNSPPCSPSSLASRQKDLVSPQRLMNITENLCPLIRPISPTSSDSTDEGTYLPLIPEVMMAAPLSPKKESHDKALSQTTVTTDSNVSVGCNSLAVKTTNLLLPSALNDAPLRKYKKILPKSEKSNNRGVESRILLRTTVENIPYGKEGELHILPKPPPASSNHHDSVINKSYADTHILDQPLTTIAAEDIYPSTFVEQDKLITMQTITKENNQGQEEKEIVVNLAGLNIGRLEKTAKGSAVSLTTSLILDDNHLQILPTIDSYKKLTNLSLCNNKIDSLIWFSRLESLKTLNLSNNCISDVDALWKLWHLVNVNLSGNQIKVIKACNNDSTNHMECLDLSNNKIEEIGNLSVLSNLKELFLHRNEITSLKDCKSNLPTSLTCLTLSENLISNLNDVSELSHLETLEKLTLKQNPCMNILQLVDSHQNPLGLPRSFDYRPFVITWCPSLVCLDFRMVTPHESSKAQWLLSQGRVRGTLAENHAKLVTYLSEVCPKESSTNDERANIDHQPPVKKMKTNIQTNVNYSIVKLAYPSNTNEEAAPSQLKPRRRGRNRRRKTRKTSSPASSNMNKTNECSSVCKHYIELIEEKARCHKLRRTNEELVERVNFLETVLSHNGLSADMIVKMEEEEMEEEREDEIEEEEEEEEEMDEEIEDEVEEQNLNDELEEGESLDAEEQEVQLGGEILQRNLDEEELEQEEIGELGRDEREAYKEIEKIQIEKENIIL